MSWWLAGSKAAAAPVRASLVDRPVDATDQELPFHAQVSPRTPARPSPPKTTSPFVRSSPTMAACWRGAGLVLEVRRDQASPVHTHRSLSSRDPERRAD